MKELILNRTSGIYHSKNCFHAMKIRKKNREKVGIRNIFEDHLTPCKYCQSMKFIFKEHKEGLTGFADERHLTIRRTGNWLLVQTDISFWKIGYCRYNRYFYLYHGNHRPNGEIRLYNKNEYHRQKDVMNNPSLNWYLDYIYDHDRFRSLGISSVKNLPKATKKQRDFRNRVRNAIRRQETRRVYDILDRLVISA